VKHTGDGSMCCFLFGPAASTKGSRKPKTNSGDGKKE
jgi:hypothetical protein